MSSPVTPVYDSISLGIMWDRLIAVTNEIVESLVRTSFSTNVRESYDLSCVLFDASGHSLAQGTYSVPTFTGTAPATMAHMMRHFPPETLRPGDVIATNDPWMGTGHLYDINIMRPIFRRGKLVGYTMSITHLPDIGGLGFSTIARNVYEEGLRIPMCKILDQGKLNEELIEIIRTNVRVEEQTIGDLMANITCNEVGGRLLVEFMDEYGVDDLAPLSQAIRSQSEREMRRKLSEIRPGKYSNEVHLEGPDGPIKLACTVTLEGGAAAVDFAGTDPVVGTGINVPLCYSGAMARYSIKCLTIPNIPNNEGSVLPISVTGPENCILNSLPPWPTGGRHVTGHFVNALVLGALAEAVPDKVHADVGMIDLVNMQGTRPDGVGISGIYFASGGFGALMGKDGAPCCPGPSNMTGQSTEAWETVTGMAVERRALLTDSGGPGEFRGGLGQEIVIRNDTGHPLTISGFGQRTLFPPKGYHGGQDGSMRRYLINDQEVSARARHIMAPGDRLKTLQSGGGGFGDPLVREREAVRRDVAEGFVSVDAARETYGYSIDDGERAA